MKKIAILGSTGSIGTQTLEVVRENGDIEVLGLAAGSNIKVLEEQIRIPSADRGCMVRRKSRGITCECSRYGHADRGRHGWTSGSRNHE